MTSLQRSVIQALRARGWQGVALPNAPHATRGGFTLMVNAGGDICLVLPDGHLCAINNAAHQAGEWIRDNHNPPSGVLRRYIEMSIARPNEIDALMRRMGLPN
jgi:hypothetical protein